MELRSNCVQHAALLLAGEQLPIAEGLEQGGQGLGVEGWLGLLLRELRLGFRDVPVNRHQSAVAVLLLQRSVQKRLNHPFPTALERGHLRFKLTHSLLCTTALGPRHLLFRHGSQHTTVAKFLTDQLIQQIFQPLAFHIVGGRTKHFSRFVLTLLVAANVVVAALLIAIGVEPCAALGAAQKPVIDELANVKALPQPGLGLRQNQLLNAAKVRFRDQRRVDHANPDHFLFRARNGAAACLTAILAKALAFAGQVALFVHH